MGCATTIKRAGGRFRRGISVPAIGLVLAMAGWAWGQKPASDDWVGKPVVPKTLHFTIRVGTPPNERADPRRSTMSKRPAARCSWSRAPSSGAGSRPRRSFRSTRLSRTSPSQIQANPRESFNYAMRAIVLLRRSPTSTGPCPISTGGPSGPERCLRARQPRHAPGQPSRNGTRPSPTLSDAIKLDPEERRPTGSTGPRAWRARRDYDKAIADCDAALRLDPRSLPRWSCGHRSGPTAKNTTGRSPITARSSVTIPSLFPAYFGRAAAQGEKGEYDKAIADLDKVIRLDPQSARQLPRPRRRLETQEGVRQGDRRPDRGHPARSAERRRLSRPRPALEREEAIRQGHRRLQRVDPPRAGNASSYCNRGFAWKAEKKYDNAHRRLHRGDSRSTPETPTPTAGAAGPGARRRRFAKALADFGQALASIPRRLRARRPRLDLGDVPRRRPCATARRPSKPRSRPAS